MTDSFDSFVNFDWLNAENDALKHQEELDLESMTSSDLFKYFLESEIAKDYSTNPAQFDYTLFTPDSTALDLITNPITNGSNATTHLLAHQNQQLAVNFSLPNSPASSHHSDEDVTMAEVKTEPLMFNSTELLRMDGELDSKASVSAVVAALLAQQPQQQQQTAKPTPQQNTKPTSRSRRASSFDSDDEQTMPTDAAELKKMTSKERRQMRNKISARNFRVRRKEYISTLEAQVQQHQDEAQQLRERMSVMEEENKKLREEVEMLRRQSTLETTLAAKPSARPSITKPNFNKDLSISGSRATDTYLNDSHILVSSAIMPEWNLDRILARSAAPKPADEAPKTTTPATMTESSLLADMAFTAAHPREAALATAFVACLSQRLIAYFAESLTQMSAEEAVRRLFPATTGPKPVPAPSQVKSDWDLPLKPDELSFSPKPTPEELPHSPAPELDPAVPSAAYMEWLYDAIIMAALSPPQAAHESEAAVSNLDRLASFFWWDEASSV